MNTVNTGISRKMRFPLYLALESTRCPHLSGITSHNPNVVVFSPKKRKAAQKMLTNVQNHPGPHTHPVSHMLYIPSARTRAALQRPAAPWQESSSSQQPEPHLFSTWQASRTLKWQTSHRRLGRWNSITNNKIKLMLNLLPTDLTWLY